MYKSISIQTRPDRNIPFWSIREHGTMKYFNYLKTNYLDTGKIKKTENKLSADELKLTTVVEWDEEKDYNAFKNDKTVIEDFLNPWHEYSQKVKITVSSLDLKHHMMSTQGPNPYPDLVIPESWASVEEFGDWWIRAGMPIMFQEKAEVFMSDDATAIALFRKGRFQVELYLIHPNPKVPEHEHPDVEVIKVRLDGKKYPYLSNTLHNGEAHGAGQRLEAEERGYPLLAIQHWLTREPTTIASMWKGQTVGPMQEALIKRFNPEAFVETGYADVTKKM
jgi:hypothetical protein